MQKEKILFYLWILGGIFWNIVYNDGFGIRVDHTFDYGMNSLELYLGKKNYFEGNVIYAEDDYKHNGDFILEYYVKNTEDIEIISKQIVEENVFIFRAYNLSDINVVWKSVDDELYVYGGDELYATIDVERKGLLVKLSFYWNQELNQNMEDKSMAKTKIVKFMCSIVLAVSLVLSQSYTASAICSSISLMGVFVSVVPLFVYECTGLIQTAVLARLQYSFSGRYAVRTGIYIDNM